MSGQRGAVLLELLLAASVVMLSAGMLCLQGAAAMKQQQKNQVRLAAELLSADLRQLQQQALYQSGRSGVYLRVSTARPAMYAVYAGTRLQRQVDFSACGCSGVYFSSVLPSTGFSNSGSPLANGSYVLRHRQLEGFRCRLTLQPVTGRVSVYEES